MTDEVKSSSLLCGFETIFTGIYLLNFNGSNLESPDPLGEYEFMSGMASSSPSSGRITLEGSIASAKSAHA